MLNCSRLASDFPFIYRYPNGSYVEEGEMVRVKGFSNDFCFYNTTSCALKGSVLKFPSNGSHFPCCENRGGSNNSWVNIMIVFMVVSILLGCYKGYLRKKAIKEAEESGDMELLRVIDDEKPGEAFFGPNMQSWSGLAKLFVFCLWGGAITASVMSGIIMPMSLQENLAPTDRASQLAMTAVLTPIQEIFQFLEDAIAVRVGSAKAKKNYKEMNLYLYIGVVGGALSGFIAFLLMLFLSLQTDIAEFLLNPSASADQALIQSGCDLIPSSSDLLVHARFYWLLIASAWVPQFVMKGIMGYTLGTGRMYVYAIPMALKPGALLSLWFGLLPHAEDMGLTPLSVLGIATSGSDWLTFFTVVIAFLISSSRNEQSKSKEEDVMIDGNHSSDKQRLLPTNIAVSNDGSGDIGRGSDNDANDVVFHWSIYDYGFTVTELRRILRSTLVESIYFMLLDVILQISISFSIYIAATEGFTLAYKFAAADAAYWIFGPSYMVGISLIFKVTGSRDVALGKAFAFYGDLIRNLVLAITVGTVAILNLSTNTALTNKVATNYGSTACEFATNPHCLIAYAEIFGDKSFIHPNKTYHHHSNNNGFDSSDLSAGLSSNSTTAISLSETPPLLSFFSPSYLPLSDSITSLFSHILAPTIFLQMVLSVLRAGLAACHDAKYMVKCGIASLILVYTPAVFVARFYFHSSASYYLAAYIPHFFLIILFAHKLRINIRQLYDKTFYRKELLQSLKK
eukprot:g2010.t1